MDHLNPLDAAFLKVEDADPHAPIVIGAATILRGPAPDQADVRAPLLARLDAIPRAREKLHTTPLDLAFPSWVTDTDFDLDHHVRRLALPRRSSEDDLLQLFADMMARPMDRDHPLWQWIIEGLARGRWAILLEFHHSLLDGVSAARVLAALSDRPPRRRRRGAPSGNLKAAHPHRSGSIRDWPPSAGGVLELLFRATRASARIVRSGTKVVGGAVGLVAGLMVPSSASTLNGRISTGRRYGIARALMREIDEICTAFDVTVNDVALAAVTAAMRNSLIRRGHRPGAHAMRSLVPVSVRAGADEAVANNQVSAMLPYLPVDRTGVVEQLDEVHRRMATAKHGGQSDAGHALTSMARFVPFAVTGPAVRLAARLPQHSLVTIATNVPGPREPLRFFGREVLEIFPYVPIAVHVRMSIAIFSYTDRLTFGITGDYDHAPDVALVGADIQDAVAELLCAARSRRRLDQGSETVR